MSNVAVKVLTVGGKPVSGGTMLLSGSGPWTVTGKATASDGFSIVSLVYCVDMGANFDISLLSLPNWEFDLSLSDGNKHEFTVTGSDDDTVSPGADMTPPVSVQRSDKGFA
jgi:hypothetical protein